jgi:hypothetical protein
MATTTGRFRLPMERRCRYFCVSIVKPAAITASVEPLSGLTTPTPENTDVNVNAEGENFFMRGLPKIRAEYPLFINKEFSLVLSATEL